jgi:hypothetical protein
MKFGSVFAAIAVSILAPTLAPGMPVSAQYQYPPSQPGQSASPPSQYEQSQYSQSQYNQSTQWRPVQPQQTQQSPQQFNLNSVYLSQGSIIPVASPSVNGEQVYNPDTIYPISLAVARDIYSSDGTQLVIPAGSEIRGELRPVEGGLKFYGNNLLTNGQSIPIQVSSDTIHDTKDPRQTSGEAIAGDAAIGAAGGALLGAVTGGGVSVGEVLGGAAAGAGIGNVTAPRVVVLSPDRSIDLILERPLQW